MSDFKSKLRGFMNRRLGVFHEEDATEPLSNQMSQHTNTMNIMEERAGDSSLLSSRASDVFPQREPMSRRNKIIIGSTVLVLGVLGIVLGTTQPWKSKENNVETQIIVINTPAPVPTISPMPSMMPSISNSPTATNTPTRIPSLTNSPTITPRPTNEPAPPVSTGPAAMYNAISDFITALDISPSDSFRRYSTDEAQGVGDVDSPQQKAVNHIAKNDFIFQDWVFLSVPPAQPRLAQRYALTVLYFALGAEQWLDKAEWLNGSLNECEWYGVFCEKITIYNDLELAQLARGGITQEQRIKLGSVEEMVVELRLEKNKLKGSLTEEIGELEHMQVLGLYSNNIGGTLPVSLFTNMKKLKRFWLNNNQFTGTIPQEVGLLSDLEDLSIASNRLNGTLPNEIGRLNKLTRIQAYQNQLTGPLPSEIGLCTELTRLFLDQNKFEGPIPYRFGDLTNLYDLRIFENEFEGVLPNSLSQLSNLRIFYADNNNFQGPIAPIIASGWKSMRKLEIWNNNIEDPIPSEFGSLMNMDTLDLHNNKIMGKLPEQLCNNGALRKLNLSGNILTGTLPAMLKKCAPKLVKLHLNNNVFSGPIPSWIENFSNVYSLHLQANELTGEIPTSMIKQKLPGLTDLKLEINKLTGNIDELCSAGGMSELSADCSGRFPEVECNCCTRCF